MNTGWEVLSMGKGLKVLADDFVFLYRKDVQDIIGNCKSYEESQ